MQKAISTEPLAQMLRSITLQRRTGLLRVARFGEGSGEEGEIYFEDGRPMRARAGQETGRAALRCISAWKHITCSFDGMSRPYPGNLPALTTPKERDTGQMPETEELPRASQRWTTHSLAQTPLPPAMPQQISATPRPEPLPPALPGRLAVFKTRLMFATAKTFQQLGRHERMVFLLLDGKRTIQDIARLTHYNEAEVEQILIHLTGIGHTELLTSSLPTCQRLPHFRMENRQ